MLDDTHMWKRGCNDLVNALIQLAASARSEAEVALVLATATRAVESGLIHPEDATTIESLARARLDSVLAPRAAEEACHESTREW